MNEEFEMEIYALEPSVDVTTRTLSKAITQNKIIEVISVVCQC